jgi:hypothetical protein
VYKFRSVAGGLSPAPKESPLGLATPFPEPDSPELRRHVIADNGRIVEVLRRALGAGAMLNAYMSADGDFAVTRLLSIDEQQGRMSLEAVAEPASSPRPARAWSATFVGFVDGEKLQFSASESGSSSPAAGQALSLPLPRQLLLLKQRKTERVRQHGVVGGGCRIRLPGTTGESLPLPVFDIGAGGLSVEIGRQGRLPPVGTRIDGCRLDLPGIGGAEVSVAIRHCSPAPGDAAAQRIGCEFIDAAPALRSLLQRFLALRDPNGTEACGRGRGHENR